jgi:DNA-binding CsgD family transcriptional regulator
MTSTRWRRLARRFDLAAEFVGVATAVCDEGLPLLGLSRGAVCLHRIAGTPAIAVDNIATITDAERLATVARETAADAGTADVALFGNGGVIGSIRVGVRLEGARRADLLTIAALASVRLAELGISAVADEPPLLDPRRDQIARAAARGHTNAEIGELLGLPENTVKKWLKQVFVRLGVANRTELKHALAQTAAPLDIPFGITRLPTVTLARGR